MYISQHFHREEFTCHCGCGANTADVELIQKLEEIRAAANVKWPTDSTNGRSLLIVSGCRCGAHNNAVGGAPESQHLRGKAADFTIRDIGVQKVQDLLRELYPGRYGIGSYAAWTHFDVREGCARWRK